MAKSSTLTALDYLAHPDKHPAAGVCAVYGDEDYLKREVLGVLRRAVLGEEDGDVSLTTIAGDVAERRDVLDALFTVSLFGSGRQLVIVEDADAFVSEHRGALEDYVARPARNGVLVLEVKTWPSTTRLAKAVAASGLTIDCKAPLVGQIKRWLIARAKSAHGVRLDAAAADALVELLPQQCGVLDQEVAKLALMAGSGAAIDERLVREHAGGWRVRTGWEMIDAAADGRAADALGQLGRLIAAGEMPQGVFPQMSHVLRQFAAAAQLIESAEADGRKMQLRDALARAGVPSFKLAAAERQLRQIGRPRAKQLTEWLLAVDLAIKGHNSSAPRARTELERLIVRLSPAAGVVVSSSGANAVTRALAGAQ